MNVRTTLEKTSSSAVIRLMYDLLLRLVWVKTHFGCWTSQDIEQMHEYLKTVRAYATDVPPHPDEIAQLLETHWGDIEDTDADTEPFIGYFAAGWMFEVWHEDGQSLTQKAMELFSNVSYEVSSHLDSHFADVPRPYDFVGFAEERWVFERLQWLAQQPEDVLWSVDESLIPAHCRHDYAMVGVLDQLLKSQRTYHPQSRTPYLAVIDQPSDDLGVWFCDIPELHLYGVLVKGPTQYTYSADDMWWFEKLTWTHAVVKVADPSRRVSFRMLKESMG